MSPEIGVCEFSVHVVMLCNIPDFGVCFIVQIAFPGNCDFWTVNFSHVNLHLVQGVHLLSS